MIEIKQKDNPEVIRVRFSEIGQSNRFFSKYSPESFKPEIYMKFLFPNERDFNAIKLENASREEFSLNSWVYPVDIDLMWSFQKNE